MTAREFFELVENMRASQKLYFKTRRSDILRESKQLEKEVDAEIKRARKIEKQQNEPKLF